MHVASISYGIGLGQKYPTTQNLSLDCNFVDNIYMETGLTKNLKLDDPLLYMSKELPLGCNRNKERYPISCLDRIKVTLEEAIALLGYQYVRYSYWIKDIVNGKSQAQSFSINISNFPEKWEKFYNDRTLYLYDPVVRIIQLNQLNQAINHGTWSSAYIWAMQNPQGETAHEKEQYLAKISELIADAGKFGLASGYYYTWGDDHRQIVLSLSSPHSVSDTQANSTVAFINKLHSMVVLTNQAIQLTHGCTQCCKTVRIDGGNAIRLTPAEIGVLQLFHKHRNATQKQIASECGRSIDTVNHHLRSIRRKFNVQGASGHALAGYAAELNLL